MEEQTLTLTRKEAAKLCNMSLPTLDIYLQRNENPMPCFRAGRKVIIPLEPLKKWLVKESAQQVADMYGLAVNRHEKALCPWHGDKNPSLSFDKRTGRCKCFACNAGGGAVDLTAVLLNLSPLEAAKRINADFGLNCGDAQDKAPSAPIGETIAQKRKREQEAERQLYSELCNRERILKTVLEKYTPETSESSSEFCAVLSELSDVQNKLENILSHD